MLRQQHSSTGDPPARGDWRTEPNLGQISGPVGVARPLDASGPSFSGRRSPFGPPAHVNDQQRESLDQSVRLGSRDDKV